MIQETLPNKNVLNFEYKCDGNFTQTFLKILISQQCVLTSRIQTYIILMCILLFTDNIYSKATSSIIRKIKKEKYGLCSLPITDLPLHKVICKLCTIKVCYLMKQTRLSYYHCNTYLSIDS